MTTEILSKFVFADPPHTALNKFELETIVAHRQAFNVLQTALLEPTWCSIDELMSVDQVDLTQIYVLYEFIGDTFQHLSQLKCRVIGPLVILQSFTYSLKFPMRNYPTWAQSLNGKLIVGISFNVDDEVDIRDKVIKLGGFHQKSINDSTSMIIVNAYNPNDQWFQDATRKQMTILKKEWLEAVHKAAFDFECDSQKFFAAEFLSQYAIPAAATDLNRTTEHAENLASFPAMPSPLIPSESQNLTSIWNNSASMSANRRTPAPMSANQRAPTLHTPVLQATSRRNKLNTSNQALSLQQPSLSFTLSPIKPASSRIRSPATLPLQSTTVGRNSMSRTFTKKKSSFLPPTQRYPEPSQQQSGQQTRTLTQASSPGYVSQGPVMSTSGASSVTQQRAVVWDDVHARISQMDSSFLRTHTQDPLDQFASDKENQPSNQSNAAKSNTQANNGGGVYLDEEERQLLEDLYKR